MLFLPDFCVKFFYRLIGFCCNGAAAETWCGVLIGIALGQFETDIHLAVLHGPFHIYGFIANGDGTLAMLQAAVGEAERHLLLGG